MRGILMGSKRVRGLLAALVLAACGGSDAEAFKQVQELVK